MWKHTITKPKIATFHKLWLSLKLFLQYMHMLNIALHPQGRDANATSAETDRRGLPVSREQGIRRGSLPSKQVGRETTCSGRLPFRVPAAQQLDFPVPKRTDEPGP